MIYRKSEGQFLETELDGEIVLMSVDPGSFHALKDSGLSIWKLIDGQRSIKQITEVLTKSFEVDADTCLKQVSEFLETMEQAKFIEKI